MVWGCFIYNQLGPIVMIPSNLDGETYVSLLKKHFLPWYNNLEQNHCSFVQDNAPPHKKKTTIQALNEWGVTILQCPPQSPDLNIMENIWAYLTDMVYQNEKQFSSLGYVASN